MEICPIGFVFGGFLQRLNYVVSIPYGIMERQEILCFTLYVVLDLYIKGRHDQILPRKVLSKTCFVVMR